MDNYIVLYDAIGPTESFACQADDADHALEQARDYLPDVRLISVYMEVPVSPDLRSELSDGIGG